MFVNTCCELLLEDLDDLIEDASGDRDVLLDPGDMFDDRNLDGGYVVVMETTLLSFGPS